MTNDPTEATTMEFERVCANHCPHDPKFYRLSDDPRAIDENKLGPMCWYEDEDGFCGHRCVPDSERVERHEFMPAVGGMGLCHQNLNTGMCRQPRDAEIHVPAPLPPFDDPAWDIAAEQHAQQIFGERKTVHVPAEPPPDADTCEEHDTVRPCHHSLHKPQTPATETATPPVESQPKLTTPIAANNGTEVVVSGSLLIIRKPNFQQEAMVAVLTHAQAADIVKSLVAAHDLRRTRTA